MTRGIYIHTKEQGQKIKASRIANNTYVVPSETRQKIGKSHLGRKNTEESKKRMGNLKRGIKQPWNSGEKHHGWKGGITPINQKIRTSLEIKLWKKACLERDNYTDQITGQRGGKLVVHHINNFADFPELRTSIENGITLSKETHIEFHKKYGKKNNSREQLLNFKRELLTKQNAILH